MFYYSKLKWYEFKETPAFSLSQGCEVTDKLLYLSPVPISSAAERSLPCLRLRASLRALWF